MPGLTTLDVLYAARARLHTEPYYFMDWSACTCGHIYTAATGKRNRDAEVVEDVGGLYASALRAVLRALDDPMADTCPEETLPHRVSSATGFVARGGSRNDGRRAAAQEMVDKAIDMLEAEEEQARLDVLAQASAVVESVEQEEPEKEGEQEQQEGDKPEGLVLA